MAEVPEPQAREGHISPGRGSRGPGKILAIIFGALGILVGLALTLGSAGLFVVNATADEDGFFTSGEHRFERGSFAIASEDIDVASDFPGWVFGPDDFADVQIEGSSTTGGSVFIGVARAADVGAYLSGVAYDEVTHIGFGPFSVDYRPLEGEATPPPPGSQAFWAASVEGPGTQTLEWDVDQGVWSVVVMNADGSRGVDASLTLGARIPFVATLAWILLGFGLFSLAGGGLLLYWGVRRPSEAPPPSPQPGTPAEPSEVDQGEGGGSAPGETPGPGTREPGSSTRGEHQGG